jgi:hypothetical protein
MLEIVRHRQFSGVTILTNSINTHSSALGSDVGSSLIVTLPSDHESIDSASSYPCTGLNYDMDSLAAVDAPLAQLVAGLSDVIETFGKKEDVNSVRY